MRHDERKRSPLVIAKANTEASRTGGTARGIELCRQSLADVEVELMTNKLIWKSDRVKIGDLKAWTANPRMSTKAQAERILKSLDKFGQVETLAIDADNNIVNGHQRYFALMTIHLPEYEVDVRRANRALTDEEKKELTITLHAGATGSWDWNQISGWNAGELQEWGFNKDLLTNWNFDALNLREMTTAEIDITTAFSKLPNKDRAPFQQMTFTVHDSQAEIIKEAMKLSKKMGDFIDTQNENSNGNAIARICETFITQNDNR